MREALDNDLYAKVKHFADGGDPSAEAIIAILNKPPAYVAARVAVTSLPNSATYTAGVWTAGANAALVLDSVTMALGDRFLRVAGDAHDGLYVVTAIGAGGGGGAPWVAKRARDMRQTTDFMNGASLVITAGTSIDTIWILTLPSPFVLDTQTPVFTQVGTAVGGAAVQSALTSVNAGVIYKRTVTLTNTTIAALGAVTSGNIAIGAVLPAGARIVGYDIGEGSFTGVDDATHATWNVSLGGAGAADIAANVNVSAGQTGFPKAGAAGTLGFPMAPQGGQQLNAHVSSSVNMSTCTAGNVVVNVFYTVGAG